MRGVVNEGFYCTCVCVMAERRCSAHADVEESDGATYFSGCVMCMKYTITIFDPG